MRAAKARRAPAGHAGRGRSRGAVPALATLMAALSGLALLAGIAPEAAAQSLLQVQANSAGGNTTYSVPIQTLLIFTALSFVPAVLLLMTSFTRIVIVLSLVRQALGLQSAPPNQVIVGIALFMTAFVMGPTLERIYADAYKPYAEQAMPFDQAVDRGSVPLREFMLRQTRATDLGLFARIAKIPTEGDDAVAPAAMPMRVLVPAFVISELKTAFQIGFMVFVPFILIDLICASVLMSLGMMMVSPVLVALPFKLVLFVLADGWNLLIGSLVASFSA
ncbi:MAG: flagellar type III secretion system pore protein FliP [Lautropia sp.]